MKNKFIILAVLLIVVVFGVFYYRLKSTPINEGPTIVTEDSIRGCYVANLDKDVYTLTIMSQNGELFEGKLSFKNFEKDSSSGTYIGTYKDGILLGDYSFNSEGMDSVMQVVFKKLGTGFVRGYGDLNESGNNFVDLENITYDTSRVFEASTDCTDAGV